MMLPELDFETVKRNALPAAAALAVATPGGTAVANTVSTENLNLPDPVTYDIGAIPPPKPFKAPVNKANFSGIPETETNPAKFLNNPVEEKSPKVKLSNANATTSTSSQAEIFATITRWGKKCDGLLAVSPDHPEKHYNHDKDKRYGTLDVIKKGAYKMFKLKRKPGVIKCGAYGTTKDYITPDGKRHGGKLVILKPVSRDLYKDTGTGKFALRGFNAVVGSPKN